jgi:hypothetical protein
MARMLDTEDKTPLQRPLDAECRIFTRYLLGRDPDDYVTARYAAAHAEIAALAAVDSFDESLVAFARIGPVFTKITDSYASLFSPRAALRKKLVLLLAILETRSPFHQTIDAPIAGSTPVLWASLAGRTIGAAAALLVGALVFVPTRMVLALTRKTAG